MSLLENSLFPPLQNKVLSGYVTKKNHMRVLQVLGCG